MTADPKPLTREEVEKLQGVTPYPADKYLWERLCADWLRMEAELRHLWKMIEIEDEEKP